MDFWVEIVTLVIPGFNDSSDELRGMAEFIASVSPDIPWHVTAFHEDYKMTDCGNTSVETLLRAADIGHEAGLNFVYAGNLPNQVGNRENTYCSKCHELLIERYGYLIVSYHVSPHATCPACGASVPGKWDAKFGGQRTSRPFVPMSAVR